MRTFILVCLAASLGAVAAAQQRAGRGLLSFTVTNSRNGFIRTDAANAR